MGYVMKLLEQSRGHLRLLRSWSPAALDPLEAGRELPGIVVTKVRMVGDFVELLLPGRPQRWRHHDSARLKSALRTTRQPVAAVPEHGMLRVDGYWFNCVSAEAELTLCG